MGGFILGRTTPLRITMELRQTVFASCVNFLTLTSKTKAHAGQIRIFSTWVSGARLLQQHPPERVLHQQLCRNIQLQHQQNHQCLREKQLVKKLHVLHLVKLVDARKMAKVNNQRWEVCASPLNGEAAKANTDISGMRRDRWQDHAPGCWHVVVQCGILFPSCHNLRSLESTFPSFFQNAEVN